MLGDKKKLELLNTELLKTHEKLIIDFCSSFQDLFVKI